MALLSPAVIGLLAANLPANGIAGVSSFQLATAIGNGFSSYMVSAPIVITINVGTAGSGFGIGFGLFLAQPLLFAALNSSFLSHGIAGIMAPPLSNAISMALSQSLLLAQTEIVSASVGTGAGTIVTIIPNSAVSIPLMIESFIGAGIVGISSASMASAIAESIDQVMPSIRGFVVVSGSASPVPSTGPGIGKII